MFRLSSLKWNLNHVFLIQICSTMQRIRNASFATSLRSGSLTQLMRYGKRWHRVNKYILWPALVPDHGLSICSSIISLLFFMRKVSNTISWSLQSRPVPAWGWRSLESLLKYGNISFRSSFYKNGCLSFPLFELDDIFKYPEIFQWSTCVPQVWNWELYSDYITFGN